MRDDPAWGMAQSHYTDIGNQQSRRARGKNIKPRKHLIRNGLAAVKVYCGQAALARFLECRGVRLRVSSHPWADAMRFTEQ